MFKDIWPYIWGSGAILMGSIFIWKREVEIGIRGIRPLVSISGAFAVIVGLISILIGLYFFLNPEILS